MNVEFKYYLGDEIEIIEIHQTGRVISLWHGERGSSYEVAYWVDGERKKEYLFASEIRAAGKRTEKAGLAQ